MGRRIPKSNKHKKLKFVDPFYKGGRQLPRKKTLPNEPPTETDHLKESFKEEEFFNFKNEQKSKSKRKKKKKKLMQDDFIVVRRGTNDADEDKTTDKGSRQLPTVFKQKRHENEVQFFNRLQKAANVAMAEAKIETKYGIELVNVDNKGNAKYIAPPKEVSEKKREKRKKSKEKDTNKKKIKVEDMENDLKKEHIEFGEVVTAPPVFTAKPRKAPEKDKAGKKNLALKGILSNDSETEKAKIEGPVAIKWKDMAFEKRKAIENERHRAIQMYRMLKNKKNEAS